MWGSDETFPLNIFLLSLVFASVVVGLPLATAGPGSGAGLSVGMALPELGGVILSTCGYFWAYYNMLCTQVSPPSLHATFHSARNVIREHLNLEFLACRRSSTG